MTDPETFEALASIARSLERIADAMELAGKRAETNEPFGAGLFKKVSGCPDCAEGKRMSVGHPGAHTEAE
ncbi:MAG: hypothetical protein ACREEC_10920 [Thermoplasmata archaeon]